MNETPPCPKCNCEYTYEMGALIVCPECAHEFEVTSEAASSAAEVRDAVGNILQDGDNATIIKDLKLKGGQSIKVGTKVRGIRIIEPVNDHNIDAKVDGHGSLYLKSSVVKKA